MLSVVLLASGCVYDATGLGTSSQSTGSESSTTASVEATSSSSTSTGGVDGTSTTGGPAGSSSSSSGEPGTSTGPEVPMLVEEGLLARWYVDEAASGTDPTVVVDHQAPGVDLPLVYAAGQPTYGELDGSRGLVWDASRLDGRAAVDIAGTKLEDELIGATEATFELVVSVEEVTTDVSRLLHFGNGGAGGGFAIGSPFLDRLVLRWAGQTLCEFESDFGGPERRVVHVVVDTNAVEPDDRLRAYIDGVALVLVDAGAPDEGAGLPLDPAGALALGNRSDGQRSFRGHLQYAAIYTAAFDQAQIDGNVELLLASDDEP